MGKEWYWSGKSSKKSSKPNNNNNNNTVGCMCAVFQIFDFHNQFQFASNENQPHIKSITTSTKSITTHTFELPEEPSIPKGAEAPRNSLKSEDGISVSSIMEEEDLAIVENFNNIQMGINQIKTSCDRQGIITSNNNTPTLRSSSGLSPALTDKFSDSNSNSPGTKTPGLVARLMGLDLLPDQIPTNNNSPNNNPNKQHQTSLSNNSKPHKLRSPQTLQNKARYLLDNNNKNSGTRSLPETPRVSSSSRRSDVDIHQHHRLSLQINKENSIVVDDDLDLPRLSSLRRSWKISKADNNCDHLYDYSSSNSSGNSTKSPGFYARQIVKQVKESVSKRTGLVDITNTLRDYDHHNQAKHKKLEEQENRSSFSCSPRLIKTSNLLSSSKEQSFQVSKPVLLSSSLISSSSTSASSAIARQERLKKGKGNKNVMVQKIMQEETFVFGRSSTSNNNNKKKKMKKSHEQSGFKRANINIPDKVIKKTPNNLSNNNNLLNINVVPTLLSVKPHQITQKSGTDHDARESKRTTKAMTSFSSSGSQSHVSVSRDTSSPSENDAVAFRSYITKILGRTGISTASHVSLSNWFSPSHPLDPSIFHRLELHYSDSNIYRGKNSSLGQRSNRKLAFDVVDELLSEILRPLMNLKPWSYNKPRCRGTFLSMQGKDLIETLCSRFDEFPCKDCQVLDDIDALIDRDMCVKVKMGNCNNNSNNNIAFDEEGEALVTEIEKDLVDTLVHETALILFTNLI